ncbi:MAG: hypothetical protein H6609_03325 [Ignavibacteriales bacterium]|nr:hypothetical protein [Ignavibacteriales bacterium]
MDSILIRTSFDNWQNNVESILKTNDSIEIENDLSIAKDDLLNEVNTLVKKYNLTSWQLIIRKVLLIIIPIAIIFYSAIFIMLFLDPVIKLVPIYMIVILLVSFISSLCAAVNSFYKLINAKKPIVKKVNDKIIINKIKY